MAAADAIPASSPLAAVAPVAKDAASARKRRRRAPAGGAADDCFTCAKRNVKCDRRRPYCSQCLEIGNECSGYKTQLTWGVGVASRGKLRGLSLPIAKAPPVNPVKTAGIKSPTKSRNNSIVSISQGAQWPERRPQQPHHHSLPPPQSQDDTRMQDDGEQQQQQQQHQHQHNMRAERTPASIPATPFEAPPGYEMARISATESQATSMTMSPPPGWTSLATPMPFSSNDPGHRYPNSRSLHLTLPGTGSMLGSSMDAMSEVDYMSPLTHSFPRDDMPLVHSPTVLYDGFPGHPGSPIPRSPISGMLVEPPRVPTACPSLVYGPSEPASSLQSHHSHMESYEPQLNHKMMDCDSMVSVSATSDLDGYSTSAQSHGPFWAQAATDEESVSHGVPEHQAWPASLQSPNPTQSSLLSANPDLTGKMAFFMDYYENTMCPSMVFIDSAGNPFRDHILQLSHGSRSLQHAICALAGCNLRMKRKISLGLHSIDLGDKRLDSAPTDPDTQPEDQSLSEEYQHRNIAVHLLNEQLNDPDKSRHDSVLATILMLCHYRMAESGIAKFHTQFAGVKKILGMRRASSAASPQQQQQLQPAAWMEALFTYFDAISASINDREAQLNTAFYGVRSDAQLLPPGAENLVGCDRELFRTISRLGRLNLLSQHRPVQTLLLPNSPPCSAALSRSTSPLDSPGILSAFKPPRPLNADHLFSPPPLPHHLQLPSPQHHQQQSQSHLHQRFDGNGFVKTLDEDDLLHAAALQSSGALGMSLGLGLMSTSPPPPPSVYDDPRGSTPFWREWKEARLALQSWEFDAGRAAAGLPSSSSTTSPSGTPLTAGASGGGNITAAQARDLGSLSEAFRYAALLYTERLASPSVPSAHASFRNWVDQVVYYATSLEAGSAAEKFLLWPLFVAGSECVSELQQGIVRAKCRDIMARSGYMNNLAALDVLERLWTGDWKEEGGGGGGRRGPFNWTKVIGGPGVDVEWIMF